jgi:acetoin utilization deacetylase AcuC-like enzyme
LSTLPQIIEDYFGHCDLVLYQAGADSHIDDPFGGRFTTEQFRLRDQIVFKKLSELEIPVVWNLAGGYQDPIEKVLSLHTITAEEFHASLS